MDAGRECMRMHIPVHEWSGVKWVVDGAGFGSEWNLFYSPFSILKKRI